MHKVTVETMGVLFWGILLVLGLAYIGSSIADSLNRDIEKLNKALNVNTLKQLQQVEK